MLLAEVAATSDAVAATRSRLAKRAALADLLRRSAASPDASDDLEIVVAYLSGTLRQRRTGLGYAALRDLPPPADAPTLTVHHVDAAFAAMAELEGRAPRRRGRRRPRSCSPPPPSASRRCCAGSSRASCARARSTRSWSTRSPRPRRCPPTPSAAPS
nr:hypothetical protein GCM10025730_17230 [Promicromonospora thailandica]